MTTKGRIARVATREFARHGFDGASIRQIAAEASVTKPVLYYYFKDKHNLYVSLLETAVAPLCEQVEQIAEGAESPLRRIRGIVTAFLHFARERPDEFHLLHRAVERREREVQVIARTYFRRTFLAISRVVKEGVDRKSFRSLNVPQTTFSVIAILVYYCTREHVIDEVLGRKQASADLIETLDRHIVGLLQV